MNPRVVAFQLRVEDVHSLLDVGMPAQRRDQQSRPRSRVAKDNELHRDIEDVRRDMREMEQRLIIKLGPLIALAIGIVAALVKLL